MEKLTIVTRKVSFEAFIKKGIRNSLRFLRTLLKTGIADFDIFIYYGHTSVTKSLLHGLKQMNANYNVNPVKIEKVNDTLIVLSDVEALQQAILLKEKGIIKKLIAGPNILEIPTKYNNILRSKAIDKILVPSEMTVNIYEKLNPMLKGKIISWYAGVDTDYWSPTTTPKNKDVVVYWKNCSKAFCIEVERILKNKGYEVHRVIYGHYSKKHFRELLKKSVFSVFLSITETQGLALAESWSMNTPTLVWDPEIEHYYLRGIQTTATPYLTSATGTKWKELDDLELILNKNFEVKDYSPREWVLNNMTDKISAQLLIDICKDYHK